MARGREIGELDCDRPFALAAAQVIEVRADEVIEQSRGVLDLDEIEQVHDMRVATRRLQAAMEVFRKCFPRKRRRAALKQVRALADALGERRDPDVSIESLESLAGEINSGDDPAHRGADRALQARAGWRRTSGSPRSWPRSDCGCCAPTSASWPPPRANSPPRGPSRS